MPNYHNPYTDGVTHFARAADMNAPLAALDQAVTYAKSALVGCDTKSCISWSGGTLTWSDTIHIYFNRTDGQTIHNSVAAGSLALSLGEFAYADLSETNNAVLTVKKAAVAAGSASVSINYDRLILGYRNAADDIFYPMALAGVFAQNRDVVYSGLSVRAIQDAPPESPANGDRYIIGTGSGDWSGKNNQLAVRVAGVWEYYTPAKGWLAFNEDNNQYYCFTTQWTAWLDQAVKSTDSPVFANIIDTGLSASLPVFSGADKKLESKSVAEVISLISAALPGHYERDVMWELKTPYTTASNRHTLLTPTYLTVNINNNGYVLTVSNEIDLSVSASWDTTSGTDYTIAANRAGKDFYVYCCQPAAGIAPVITLSANSTVPTGYTASSSRKVGGFHCLCVAVGTIGGHALDGFVAGDILPASIWDLNHRAANSLNEGMLWNQYNQQWEQIYLASDNGASGVQSVYGATIMDTINWMDIVDRGGKVGMKLLNDSQFQLAASGSNEGTNISGSSDPVTTGGHIDTAGRRMISNLGHEDMCGAMWQWLLDQSYRFDAAANHAHTENTAASYVQNATTSAASGDVAPAWADYALPGSKGSLYRQGTYGDVKLRAGAPWNGGSFAGSRARTADYYRWRAASHTGGRFAVEPA